MCLTRRENAEKRHPRFYHAIRNYIGEVDDIPVDFIGSSYSRYVSITGDQTAKLITKGHKPGPVPHVRLSRRFKCRQLTVSGWGPTTGLMPFLRRELLFKLGSNAVLPPECSIMDAFRLAGKKEQHPKLVVILAGLNDLVSIYEKNQKQVPRTADGQLVLMDIIKSFITSIRQIRLAYGKPYPYIFWVGFGRTKCGSYSPDLLRWMEKIDTLLTKAVRRQSWPEWLHYTPLVRSSMKKSIGKYNSSLDQLHWTRDEARQFSIALGNQMNYFVLTDADVV